VEEVAAVAEAAGTAEEGEVADKQTID